MSLHCGLAEGQAPVLLCYLQSVGSNSMAQHGSLLCPNANLTDGLKKGRICLFPSMFLSVGTIDILGQIILR